MAMDEEITRDERVFLMGEEVAQYDGAYKVNVLAESGKDQNKKSMGWEMTCMVVIMATCPHTIFIIVLYF